MKSNYDQAYQKCLFKKDNDNGINNKYDSYKNDESLQDKESNYDQAYQKCLFKQTISNKPSIYDHLMTEWVYEQDIVCPVCQSVHVNEFQEERSDDVNSTIKTYECGDCNNTFKCQLKPIVIRCEIL